MNAENETNRLPLRAGAMLLVAIAIVCIALGIGALNSGDDDPDAALKAAGESASQAADSEKPAATTTGASASSAAKPSTDAADVPELCVLNAGTVDGLAKEVGEALTSDGFKVAETANLSSASVTENTIFYTPDQKEAAEKVAKAVPGDAATELRPDAFTRCLGQLAVVVVSR